MATKEEVHGVGRDRKTPVVIPQPDRPERQFMSKDEVLKAKAAEKEANEAAEAARLKVLKDRGIKAPEPGQSKEEKDKADKLALLKRQLANAEKQLSANPKSAAWKSKVKSLSEELEVLESQAE